MKKLALYTTLIATLAICAPASTALTFDEILVESWVGTGTNQSVLVVDFGTQSFAFGYAFDGDKTGWDMLSYVADQTDLDIVDDTEYGGHLINTMSYHGCSATYDSADWANSNWWEYWTSSDGTAWTSSWVGCGDRVLTDGSWDGWTFSPPWPETGTPPNAPVPEPSSLAAICSLIGLAGSVRLLLRK